MTIKIEFPADNLEAAKHLGAALTALGEGATTVSATLEEFTDTVLDTVEETGENKITARIEGSVTTTDTGARLDEHGVPFNPDMCSTAAIPFYASGAHTGQWKKKKGVDQAVYDEWYAEAKPAGPATQLDDQVNTTGAFQPDGGGTTADPTAPHDAGTLMAWVSGMQGAGRLTQDQVNSAYEQAELTMPDIFPSEVNTVEAIKERVGKLYATLSAWA